MKNMNYRHMEGDWRRRFRKVKDHYQEYWEQYIKGEWRERIRPRG